MNGLVVGVVAAVVFAAFLVLMLRWVYTIITRSRSPAS